MSLVEAVSDGSCTKHMLAGLEGAWCGVRTPEVDLVKVTFLGVLHKSCLVITASYANPTTKRRT
jgi:hypothetical protein